MASVSPTQRPRWPSAEDRERLRRYYRNMRLLAGEHRSVFVDSNEFAFEYDDSREYVTVNLCGRLTNLLTSRAFGEHTQVSAPDEMPDTQAFLEWVCEENRTDALFQQLCRDGSSCGDAVGRVRYDADRQMIVLERLEPSLYYAEFDARDSAKRTAAIVAQIVQDAQGKPYLWQERHELRDGAGWIVNLLYKLHGDLKSGEVRFDPEKDRVSLETCAATQGLPDEAETGVDDLLVVHVANGNAAGAWGVSDYADIASLQGELNNRWTQRAEVLDKFTDPFMWGPDLGNEFAEYRMRELKYITVPPGETGAPVGMLVWDAQLTVVQQAIKDTISAFAASAGVDFQALLPPEGGGPVSGRALRMAQMQTQGTAVAKQQQFRHAIQQLLSLATKLANAQGVVLDWQGAVQVMEPADLDVRFGDGLPTDRMEDIQEQAEMLSAGVQSQHEAIKVLHNLDDEQAQQRMDEIAGERKTSAPQVPSLTLGPTFTPVEPDGGQE